MTRSLFQASRLRSCLGSSFLRAATHHLTDNKRFFQTNSEEAKTLVDHTIPGSAAFADCEAAAVVDLYYEFARKTRVEGECYLDPQGVRELLESIGERPDEDTLQELFHTADLSRTGRINLKVRINKLHLDSLCLKLIYPFSP